MIAHEQLVEIVRGAILERARGKHSQATGRFRPGQRTAFVTVTLSPGVLRDVAEGRYVVPREVDGVEIRIAEKPARVHKPTGRYMATVMATGTDRPGAVGTAFLLEEA
jgi:hypothetical protein